MGTHLACDDRACLVISSGVAQPFTSGSPGQAPDRFRAVTRRNSAISRTTGAAERRLETSPITLYVMGVILSFADRETERIWMGRRSRRFPSDLQDAALRKLRLLNAAGRLEDLRVPPGNRLEALKGDRKGQYAVRVNDQWRVCFRWVDGGAEDVEIVDYH